MLSLQLLHISNQLIPFSSIGAIVIGMLSTESEPPLYSTCRSYGQSESPYKYIASQRGSPHSLPKWHSIQSRAALLTDAARYKVKAGNCLQGSYPKMIHLTCLAHGMHRFAHAARAKFPHVDRLIVTVMEVFLKAPSHRFTFQQKLPELALPSELCRVLLCEGFWSTTQSS